MFNFLYRCYYFIWTALFFYYFLFSFYSLYLSLFFLLFFSSICVHLTFGPLKSFKYSNHTRWSFKGLLRSTSNYRSYSLSLSAIVWFYFEKFVKTNWWRPIIAPIPNLLPYKQTERICITFAITYFIIVIIWIVDSSHLLSSQRFNIHCHFEIQMHSTWISLRVFMRIRRIRAGGRKERNEGPNTCKRI